MCCVFSEKNLKIAIEVCKELKNQQNKPFTWGKDNVYLTTCPHCRKHLQYPSMVPKVICYKCGEIIDNILKFSDLL